MWLIKSLETVSPSGRNGGATRTDSRKTLNDSLTEVHIALRQVSTNIHYLPIFLFNAYLNFPNDD
jgi:hypothetical protein